FIVGDREAGPFARGQEIVHQYPATRLKHQSQGVRGMAKVLCQELAGRDQVATHRFLQFGRLPRMQEVRSGTTPPWAVVVAFSACVNPGRPHSSSPSPGL